MKPANIINHIGLVLDASGSMYRHTQSLVTVADSQIKYLAQRSQELDQETRVSVWTFSDRTEIKCVVWDKDVLRLPSIAPFYRAAGQTAFIDATLQSLRDLAETPERYGDHSFLVYVLTDGAENDSRAKPTDLRYKLDGLPNHWTVAALVPDINGVHAAKNCGFAPGNIEKWDTNSATGVSEVVERIRVTTDAYMTARQTGVRSTKSLFTMDAVAVNAVTISQAGLKPLPRDSYMLVPVTQNIDVSTFTKQCGHNYRTGSGFYQLSKRESIQPQKKIAIVERNGTNQVYMGQQARDLLGLPDIEVRVNPDHNPDYFVFVQSTSNNRKLMAGTKYLYLI